MKLTAAVLPALMLATMTGCRNVQTRSYQLTVRNESVQPVTVWLTKNGPPWEMGWKSPEDLAIESPGADEPIGGVVVPAGQSRATKEVKGKFLEGVDAVLRVYVGQRTFNELLAISRGSPNRMEILLHPGPNRIVVSDDGSRIKVSSEDQIQPPMGHR